MEWPVPRYVHAWQQNKGPPLQKLKVLFIFKLMSSALGLTLESGGSGLD